MTANELLIYLGDDDVAIKTSVHILHVALHSNLQSTPTNLFLLRPHHHTLALCRQLLGLPTIPYFPGCSVSWPHCPASWPRPSLDAKCPVFRPSTNGIKIARSKCMQDCNVLASMLKLGKLILRKIIKIVAARCHILKLQVAQLWQRDRASSAISRKCG